MIAAQVIGIGLMAILGVGGFITLLMGCIVDGLRPVVALIGGFCQGLGFGLMTVQGFIDKDIVRGSLFLVFAFVGFAYAFIMVGYLWREKKDKATTP